MAAGSAAVAVTAVLASASPVSAADRPTGVAFVRAWQKAYIHHDGSVTLGAGLKCVSGWSGVELDMQLNQGDTSGSNYIIPTVPCDGAWHAAHVTVSSFYPTPAHVGAITISSQFLVTNDESGDSAGGHQAQRPAEILCRWCSS